MRSVTIKPAAGERTGIEAVAVVLVGASLLSILYLGGERPVALLWASVLTIVTIGWSILTRPVPTTDAMGDLAPFIAAIACFAAWAFVGMTSWSVVPAASWTSIAYACSLIVAIPALVLSRSGWSTFLLRLVVALALFLCVFGFFERLTGSGGVLFAPKTYHLDSLTGFFVNRNAAADFLVVGIAASLAIWHLRDKRSALDLAPCLIFLPTLLLTFSRAGIVLGFLTFALGFVVGSSFRRKIAVLAVSIGAVVLALLAVVLLRQGDFVASNVARLHLWRDAVAAIMQKPLLGWGAGTYPQVSAYTRGEELSYGYTWESSHSIYLDLAANVGVPMMLLVVVLVGWGVVQLLRSGHSASVVAGVALVVLGVHGIVDFTPSTFGVVLAAAVLVGACRGAERKTS